jgi:hypothetical protein
MSGKRQPPWKSEPNNALLTLHEFERQQGRDPFKPTPVTVVEPTGPPPREFRIEPADWEQIRRDEQEQERRARVRAAQELLESVEPPPQPTPPAAKSRWRRSGA